jgi:tetratricopeptide (TPR) repeat protein
MQTSGASQNPERLKSRLWELFYRADGTGKVRIARYLAWYLLGLNDYQGLALIFTQMKRYTGSDWIPFYHGIYDALLGEYSDSIDEFKKAYSVVPRWQTLYNLGIVQLKREDPTAALNDLQKADSTLTGDNETLIKSPRRAQIHVALADTLSRLGNTEAAKREALYAQDMDPNNLSAALLLKKLDSSVQK